MGFVFIFCFCCKSNNSLNVIVFSIIFVFLIHHVFMFFCPVLFFAPLRPTYFSCVWMDKRTNKHSTNKIGFFMFESYLPEIQKSDFEKHILQARCSVKTASYILQNKKGTCFKLHLWNSIDIIHPSKSAVWLERWSQVIALTWSHVTGQATCDQVKEMSIKRVKCHSETMCLLRPFVHSVCPRL